MTQNEKKVFLTLIILTFGFLFSGYTIKNAEYMTIAEKYTEKLKDLPIIISDVNDSDDVFKVKNNISNTKDEFLNEIQQKYSSKWSDKLLLGISYRKFDKNFNKIMYAIEKKEENILFSNNGNLISFAEEKPKNIEKEIEEEPKLEQIIEQQIIEEKSDYINMKITQNITINDDFISVLHNANSNNILILSKGDKQNDFNITEEFIEYNKYKNSMVDEFVKSTFFKVERPALWENGKSFIAKDIKFVWHNGKYNILSKNTQTWSDNVIIRLENGFEQFGKAVIYNGNSFINGLWIEEDNGKINYFDNFGKIVTLAGERLWISICDEGDLQI
ncbi:MAG: hypothetical protein M0R46_03255 [Candidatus Muirbacterium halophilum]|nr:hypothetical protein [Candidatus Muirbacterium halophilum]MCK9474906.1 hypothetical protein [Candidatus Muirbacterium halophilum]